MTAQKATKGGHAEIIAEFEDGTGDFILRGEGGLFGLGAYLHGAKFEHGERSGVAAATGLVKQNRSARSEFDD